MDWCVHSRPVIYFHNKLLFTSHKNSQLQKWTLCLLYLYLYLYLVNNIIYFTLSFWSRHSCILLYSPIVGASLTELNSGRGTQTHHDHWATFWVSSFYASILCKNKKQSKPLYSMISLDVWLFSHYDLIHPNKVFNWFHLRIRHLFAEL